MYNVSQAYKDSMKSQIRNHSYMRVTLGLINQDAQNTAYVEDQGIYYNFSDFQGIFRKTEDFSPYATYEKDFFKADGSMKFLPRSESNYIKNGIISRNLHYVGFAFEFIFSSGKHDIKGLTVKFGENYPSKITVVTSSGYRKEYDLENRIFETSDVFTNTGSITIQINNMSMTSTRPRIDYIKFGLGLEYDNEWIYNIDYNATLSVIDEDLPQSSFSIELKNEEQIFNVDNPNSAINFFEPGQNLSVSSGYELDDGMVEWMPLQTMYINDWSADDEKLTIQAVDCLQFMSDNYYKGVYSSVGISLYDLAVDVFTDAGFSEDEYVLDEYLKDVVVHNPLPNVTHKEALQIIANAGRSILSYDRYGRPSIQTSFLPDFTASDNGTLYFSDGSGIEDAVSKKKYATYEQDYWTANGDFYFAPKSGIADTEYISSQIANAAGSFTTNPLIEIQLEASFKCYGIKIKFSDNLPEAFTIRTYLNDAVNSTNTISSGIEEDFEFSYEFPEFDKMTLEFTKGSPNSRIHIQYFTFGEESNYMISYDDMYSPPIGTQLEIIKRLKVSRTVYSNSNTTEELITDEIVYQGENLIYYFDDPSYNYSIEMTDGSGNVQISSSGCYFVEIRFLDVNIGNTVSFTVKGKKYNLSTSIYTKQLNNRGNDKEWNNPLISDYQHCIDVAEWISDYYTPAIEYEIEYRGDPALDAGDVIFHESQYADRIKTIIEEMQLGFNGGLSGTLRTRRRENVDRTENKLADFR